MAALTHDSILSIENGSASLHLTTRLRREPLLKEKPCVASANTSTNQNLNAKLVFIGVLIKRNGYAQAGELHLNTVGDDVLGVPFA